MKKKTKVILTIVIVFLIFGVGIGTIFFNKIANSIVLQPITPIHLEEVSDGTYLGNANNDMIVVEVNVTVADHKMTHIDLLKHKNGLGSKAE